MLYDSSDEEKGITIPLSVSEEVEMCDEEYSEVSEEEWIAYFGALFALAAADGRMDSTEIDVIFEVLVARDPSEEVQKQIRTFLVSPPALKDCLADLVGANNDLRFGLMMAMVNVSWADEVLDPAEISMLDTAQAQLGINNEERDAIDEWVRATRQIEARGEDDETASEALKSAAAGLTGVGVPIAAVYFGGSVVGLSAAGITSGLAALGLGFGMVPGIGTAIAGGVGIYLAVKKVLSISQERREREERQLEERRAQLIVENLQQAINDLIERVCVLEEQAAQGDSNREALEKLMDRLKALRQTVETRKR